MAARYGTEFWTTGDFEVARRELTRLMPHIRWLVIVDLLPVAARHGLQDFVDDSFADIAKQEDPKEGVSAMVRAIHYLPLCDPRRDLLRQYWVLAVDSDNPRMGSLIDGFELLDPQAERLHGLNLWLAPELHWGPVNGSHVYR